MSPIIEIRAAHKKGLSDLLSAQCGVLVQAEHVLRKPEELRVGQALALRLERLREVPPAEVIRAIS